MRLGRQPKIPFPDRYKGFRLIRTHGRVWGIPPTADEVRLLAEECLFDHPAVKSAASLDAMRDLIDRYDPAEDRPEPVARRGEYDVVRLRGVYHAVPRGAGALDLDFAEDRAVAGVVSGASLAAVDEKARASAAGRPVEFAGWLPVYIGAGNCGAHPQFGHTQTPPPGYRFTRSGRTPSVKSGLLTRMIALAGPRPLRWWFAAAAVVRFPFAFVRPREGVTLAARWRVFVAALSLFLMLLRKGCRPLAAARFVVSRHLQSQLLLGGRHDLVFLTSMPYTFGQNPWVIEVEDPTTLFYPLIQNGHTCDMPVRESPYYPIVKALLEADHCRAVLTHMRSSATLISALFDSEVIRRKVVYAPLGVKLPARFQRHDPEPADAPVELLFINSWCQVAENFFVRGGLDVLEAFGILRQRYPNLRLTLRTSLPDLADHYHRIMADGRVRVIDRFLTAEEMAELHASSHVFLLPAARVHIVSLLQAMSYGLAVVGTDGWGMEEYLEDGRNGLVVRGRHGRASWADDEAGVLRENYEVMYTPDSAVVAGIVEAVSRLVEDREFRRRLGRTARADVETRYTLGNWNRGMKAAFDLALGTADEPAAPPALPPADRVGTAAVR
jgi:glycosyltransferase involved in cell wall biosynthesis